MKTFPGAAAMTQPECMTDDEDGGDTSTPPNGSAGTDCDDSNPSINATVTYYTDTDEDGFGDNDNFFCSDSTTKVSVSTIQIVMIQSPAINPSATELVADRNVDQDCDDQELCYTDGDTDGVGGATAHHLQRL